MSRSSTEAEYRSLASVVAEISWLQSLLSELHFQTAKTPIIWRDNLSTVHLAANPILHAGTKHIELDLYFVQEKVMRKQIEVRHVPVVDQLIYSLKLFQVPLLVSFVANLNLTTLSLRGAVKQS